jgi:hypothetical protein
MTDLSVLQAAQAAAFAAWKAAPAKPAARKAELAAALDAATKAVAAAKKAAVGVVELDYAAENARRIAEISAKAAADAAMSAHDARCNAAVRIFERAQEWPRCGESWGDYPGEKAAEKLLRAEGVWDELLMEDFYS